jgi:C4-type Zn-finger protein
VEIHIGIAHSAREIVFESDKTAAEVEKTIADQVAGGDGAMLRLEDNKGHVYLVPTKTLTYVELTQESSRKVGFAP